MTHYDQRYQHVETQYNAEHITIQQPFSLTEKQRNQNRMRMLERVQATWIDGVLEPSVQGAAQIALQLENKPSAIVTPLWQVLREFDTTGPLSPAHVSIMQIYDHACGEMLILGELGAGKTTLLLELTRALLQRARQDEAHPIPVVFLLSSWATRRQTLTEWFASELHSKYQVPLPLARSWIETDQVLPLLDGLDEVAAAHREACVGAINMYRRAHGLIPTVVCSRQTDYLALSRRLLLRAAVVVQPLTSEQIEVYLTSGGERLVALRQILRKDADLRTLASTPLMLNVLTVAYQGTKTQEIAAAAAAERKQEEVFSSYVQRMLTRRTTSTRYTPQQTIHWLSYLAGQMKRQSQSIFYIEQMQPNWLSGDQLLRAYPWLAVRSPGVLMGVLVSLAINIVFSFPDPVPYTDIVLLGGLLGGLLSGGRTTQRLATGAGEVRGPPRSRLLPQLGTSVLIGLGIGLRHGLGHGLGSGPGNGLRHGLGQGLQHSLGRTWPSIDLGSVLTFGLIFGLCSILLLILIRSDTAETQLQLRPLVWSTKWQRLIRSTEVRNGLLVGLLIGLSYGLSHVLTNAPKQGLALGLAYGLAYGLTGGLLSLLLIGKSNTVQLTDRLIWSPRSLRQSLLSKQHASTALQVMVLIGFLAGLNTGLTIGLNTEPTRGLNFGLGTALSYGLIFGLGYWFLLGLFQGVSSESIRDQTRMFANQGIHRSAFNGLVLGLLSTMTVWLYCVMSYKLRVGLINWLLFSLGNGPTFDLGAALSYGLVVGLSAGLLVGILKGSLACERHYVLRTLLWCAGSIPWNYPRFLDYEAERILLRKVGGGYIFFHQLLLDHFANLEVGPGSATAADDGLERLPPAKLPSASVVPTRADKLSDMPTSPLPSTSVHSDIPRLLPCGHEQRTPHARFCSVCGAPVLS